MSYNTKEASHRSYEVLSVIKKLYQTLNSLPYNQFFVRRNKFAHQKEGIEWNLPMQAHKLGYDHCVFCGKYEFSRKNNAKFREVDKPDFGANANMVERLCSSGIFLHNRSISTILNITKNYKLILAFIN